MTWPGSLMHLRSAAELKGSADCLTVALAAVVLLCLSLSSGLICMNAGGISKRKNKGEGNVSEYKCTFSKQCYIHNVQLT